MSCRSYINLDSRADAVYLNLDKLHHVRHYSIRTRAGRQCSCCLCPVTDLSVHENIIFLFYNYVIYGWAETNKMLLVSKWTVWVGASSNCMEMPSWLLFHKNCFWEKIIKYIAIHNQSSYPYDTCQCYWKVEQKFTLQGAYFSRFFLPNLCKLKLRDRQISPTIATFFVYST